MPFILLFCSAVHVVSGVKAGEVCAPSSVCDTGSHCTSSTTGGTCECDSGRFQQDGTCYLWENVCDFEIARHPIQLKTPLPFTVDRLTASETVTWYYGSNKNLAEVGSCPPPQQGNCTSQSAAVTLSRSDTISTLTLQNFPSSSEGESVVCKVGNVQKRLWIIDVYSYANYIPSSPSWKYSQHKIELYGELQVINFTSSQGCYGCRWSQQMSGQSQQNLKITEERLAVYGTGKHNVTCKMSVPLHKAPGVYAYVADFSNIKTNTHSFKIDHPPAPIHNCPAFVQDREPPFNCTCFPLQKNGVNQVGLPARQFAWLDRPSFSNVLTLDKVTKEDHSMVFTCADQSGVSFVKYTLRVAHGPSKVSIVATKLGSNPTALTLICVPLEVYPTPTMTWRNKVNTELGQGPTLEVKATDLDESWEVVCEAKNTEVATPKLIARIDLQGVLRQLNSSLELELNASNQLGKGVVIGVAVMLVLLLLGAVVVFVVFRLKRRGMTTKPQKCEERRVQLVDITALCQNNEADTDQTAGTRQRGERGFPEGASNYDALDGSQVDTISPYSNLVVGKNGTQDVTSHSQKAHDKPDPLYANTKEVMEDEELAIYANS